MGVGFGADLTWWSTTYSRGLFFWGRVFLGVCLFFVLSTRIVPQSPAHPKIWGRPFLALLSLRPREHLRDLPQPKGPFFCLGSHSWLGGLQGTARIPDPNIPHGWPRKVAQMFAFEFKWLLKKYLFDRRGQPRVLVHVSTHTRATRFGIPVFGATAKCQMGMGQS